MTWRRFSFSLLVLLQVIACTSHQDAKKTPVLKVNGQIFTAADVGGGLAKRLKNFDALAAKDPSNVKRAREGVIQSLIVGALLEQYAKAHSITVSADEVDVEFNRVRKGYPDDFTFKAALVNEGQTVDEWKKDLSQSLLQKKVFENLPLPPEKTGEIAQEAHHYYDVHHDEFDRPAQVHLQQILVSREDDAERIAHSLKSGASFAEMARKFSISPDGPQGGDVGYISKGSVPAFDVAFGLKPGQSTGVVKSSYGFHIMKVLDKRPPGHLTFEQVKTRLVRQVTAQKQQEVFNRWLEDAVKSAHIERNDNLLDRIKVRTEAEEE